MADATGDAQRKQTAQIRLNGLQGEYQAFTKAARLPTQPDRAQVAGFSWKEDREAAKQGLPKKTVAITSEHDRMLSKNVEGDNRDMHTVTDFEKIRISGKDGEIEAFAIGNIDTSRLEPEFGRISKSQVIATGERVQHIKERHPDDYEMFLKYGHSAITDPMCILKDEKNEGTVFYVKKIQDTNINVIVRLALEGDPQEYCNSVMTFFRIRDKNLKRLMKRNKVLYFLE